MIECEPNLINDCPLGFDITPKLSLQVCKRNLCLVGYRKECFDTINKLVLNEKRKFPIIINQGLNMHDKTELLMWLFSVFALSRILLKSAVPLGLECLRVFFFLPLEYLGNV